MCKIVDNLVVVEVVGLVVDEMVRVGNRVGKRLVVLDIILVGVINDVVVVVVLVGIFWVWVGYKCNFLEVWFL